MAEQEVKKEEKQVGSMDDLDDNLTYPQTYKKIRIEVDELIVKLKEFKLDIKKIEHNYIHDMKYLDKRKRHRKNNDKPTGFNKPRLIPEKMADLIGVPHGTEMSGPEYTRKFYQYLEENKLYGNTKKVFRVNDAIRDTFALTKEQIIKMNKSNDDRDTDGLNFTTIQRYFSKEFNKLKEQIE